MGHGRRLLGTSLGGVRVDAGGVAVLLVVHLGRRGHEGGGSGHSTSLLLEVGGRRGARGARTVVRPLMGSTTRSVLMVLSPVMVSPVATLLSLLRVVTLTPLVVMASTVVSGGRWHIIQTLLLILSMKPLLVMLSLLLRLVVDGGNRHRERRLVWHLRPGNNVQIYQREVELLVYARGRVWRALDAILAPFQDSCKYKICMS